MRQRRRSTHHARSTRKQHTHTQRTRPSTSWQHAVRTPTPAEPATHPKQLSTATRIRLARLEPARLDAMERMLAGSSPARHLQPALSDLRVHPVRKALNKLRKIRDQGSLS